MAGRILALGRLKRPRDKRDPVEKAVEFNAWLAVKRKLERRKQWARRMRTPLRLAKRMLALAASLATTPEGGGR